MAEEKHIRILEWPKEKARLEHYFQVDKPCPVSIVFEENPAYVHLKTDPERPIDVNMDMNLKAVEDIPLCIKICEPICATSSYEIGINLLGSPLASITVNGTTVLAECKDTSGPGADEECIDFIDADPKKDMNPPYKDKIVTINPLSGSGPFVFSTSGAPAGQMKLKIPDTGLDLRFDQPVKYLELLVTNYGNPAMQFTTFRNNAIVQDTTEIIENQHRTITLPDGPVDQIHIKGGSNEASLSSVCYIREPIIN